MLDVSHFSFQVSAFQHFCASNAYAECIGDKGGEFDVIAEICFRLFAVAPPQFREGFAVAVFRAHPQVPRDAVQRTPRLAVAKLSCVAQVN